jgi:hypothetical protein
MVARTFYVMTEREMEHLLYHHPDLLLGEPLKAVARQPSSPVGRADLIFEHPNGYRLIVEVKKGRAPRGAGDQLHDYWGADKAVRPNTPIEMMVVANEIPHERRLYLEKRDIEAREIPEKRFRDVAAQVGYIFTSEQEAEVMPQVHSFRKPKSQTESSKSPIAALDLASSFQVRPPALLMNLHPPQFKNLLLPRFRATYLWLGTKDQKAESVPEDQISHVYFKENGQKGTILVNARAEFIRGITPDPPDDPEHRLPGYEDDREDRFYLKVRNLECLPNPMPIEALTYHRNRKSVPRNNQGLNLIDDPLTPP